MSTKTNEWFTPAKYIAAVREVLGDIELDPASCEFANRTVNAKRFYTQGQNGLDQPWHARTVFLNPPYGKNRRGGSNLEAFVKRLVQQYEQGHVEAAILLIPVNTGTRWFDEHLWDYYICFPKKRIRFNTEKGVSDGASFPTLFVYLGPSPQKFVEVFSKFGRTGRLESGVEAPAKMRKPELWQEVSA